MSRLSPRYPILNIFLVHPPYPILIIIKQQKSEEVHNLQSFDEKSAIQSTDQWDSVQDSEEQNSEEVHNLQSLDEKSLHEISRQYPDEEKNWCFYPHWSRDSVSSVCGIFILILNYFFSTIFLFINQFLQIIHLFGIYSKTYLHLAWNCPFLLYVNALVCHFCTSPHV